MLRRVPGLTLLAVALLPAIAGCAASPPQPASVEHDRIGPPIAPRPAEFAGWPHEQRAEWLAKSLDYLGFYRETDAWIAGGDITGVERWASGALRSSAADPAVARVIADLYEALAAKAADPPLRYEPMRRAAIYRFGGMALTFVDDRVCADDGARQETRANRAAESARERAWLKTVTPQARAQVITLALEMENASWGKRRPSLLVCWDSRDALRYLDLAGRQELGRTTVTGRTADNVYQPTVPGWIPPL